MAIPRYDAIAEWYVAWADSDPWVHRVVMAHEQALVAELPPGSRVLDLGCGEGVFSRLLADRGYRVTGIDHSPALIEFARDRSPDVITFAVDDAQTLRTQPDGTFDAAICVLALMDIPDLDAVYTAVRRVVRPSGGFTCVVMHPAFDPPGARWEVGADGNASGRVSTRYLREGEWRSAHADGVRGQVGAWHRTLGTYLNRAIAAGWQVEAVEEWPGLAGETPNEDIPRLLCLRFRR